MSAPAVAYIFGQAVTDVPHDLFIPPDALQVVLHSFEGPLDLLLYLIRKQNIDVLDIPMVTITQQYLGYIAQIDAQQFDLAAEYLLMAAVLIEIKSRLLLPTPALDATEDEADPRAELVRRLLAYEQMKLAAQDFGRFATRRTRFCMGVFAAGIGCADSFARSTNCRFNPSVAHDFVSRPAKSQSCCGARSRVGARTHDRDFA